MESSTTGRRQKDSELRRIEYAGSVHDEAEIEVRQLSDRITVNTRTRRGNGEVNYTITVPRGTALEIGSISSDVNSSDVCGPLSLNTTSGDVMVDCVEGDAEIQSALAGAVSLICARKSGRW